MIKVPVSLLTVFLTAATTPSPSKAAEIKLLAAGALEHVLGELLPQFEKQSGHHFSATYGPVGALTDRLAKGEAVDVAIVSDTQIDELQKLGKVVGGTRLDVARTGVGAFMPKNSPKPDISSVDAFKRTLLAAKAVTYADPASGGAGGIYMAHLMGRLGISTEMDKRTKFDPRGGLLMYEIVANGEADLGFDVISIILVQPSVEFLGPLPEPIQHYTTFAAGIGAASDQAEAGKAFIEFLASPPAQARMKANALEWLKKMRDMAMLEEATSTRDTLPFIDYSVTTPRTRRWRVLASMSQSSR
jgi:molybdate transport system substrate-binding protein